MDKWNYIGKVHTEEETRDTVSPIECSPQTAPWCLFTVRSAYTNSFPFHLEKWEVRIEYFLFL